jgi:CRISPR-associated protein Cas2
VIILTLTNCPNALRGDLTRWLFEVDTNLYVGKLSKRVRDNLWERVTKSAKSGRAVMVYPSGNEQGFEFRVWGETWEPVDFDGLMLMLRPHPDKVLTETDESTIKPGYSKASKRFAAKRFTGARGGEAAFPDSYVIIDIETTGLLAETDEIIEIGAIKVQQNKETESFQSLICINIELPPSIANLTGISHEELIRDGRVIKEVLEDLQSFICDLPIVSHNVSFDMSFLRYAFEKYELQTPENTCIDTLRLSRKLADDPPDYKLETLMDHFGIEHNNAHRAIGDCRATMELYNRLRTIYYDDTKC